MSTRGLIHALLEERLPDALRDPSMRLAMHDERVDRAAHVIDGRIFHDIDRARLRIDLYLADVTPERKSAYPDGLVAFGLEWSAQIVREVASHLRSRRDLE